MNKQEKAREKGIILSARDLEKSREQERRETRLEEGFEREVTRHKYQEQETSSKKGMKLREQGMNFEEAIQP